MHENLPEYQTAFCCATGNQSIRYWKPEYSGSPDLVLESDEWACSPGRSMGYGWAGKFGGERLSRLAFLLSPVRSFCVGRAIVLSSRLGVFCAG